MTMSVFFSHSCGVITQELSLPPKKLYSIASFLLNQNQPVLLMFISPAGLIATTSAAKKRKRGMNREKKVSVGTALLIFFIFNVSIIRFRLSFAMILKFNSYFLIQSSNFSFCFIDTASVL